MRQRMKSMFTSRETFCDGPQTDKATNKPKKKNPYVKIKVPEIYTWGVKLKSGVF